MTHDAVDIYVVLTDGSKKTVQVHPMDLENALNGDIQWLETIAHPPQGITHFNVDNVAYIHVIK
jgi:hypothetical protein